MTAHPRIGFKLAILLLSTILITGCVANAPKTIARPAAADLAEQAWRDGRFDEAAQQFQQAAVASRQYRDHYRLRAAEAWRENGDLSRVGVILEAVRLKKLEPQAKTRAQLLMAEEALHRQDTLSAQQHLDALPQPLPADVDVQARATDLSAKLFQAQGAWLPALQQLTALHGLVPSGEQADIKKRMIAIVNNMDDASLTQQVNQISSDDPLLPVFLDAMTQRKLPLPDHLRVALRRQPSLSRSLPEADASGYRTYQKIGLLTHKSGPFAAASAAMTDGFFYAFYANERDKPTVLVADAGNSPAQASQAYQSLLNQGAEVVVGPLDPRGVDALFRSAQLNAPVIALNQPSQDVTVPVGSVSFALKPEADGDALANLITQRGLSRIVILDQGDGATQRILNQFKSSLQNQGGTVVKTISIRQGSEGSAHQAAMQAIGQQSADALVFATDRTVARSFMTLWQENMPPSLPMFATPSITQGRPDAILDEPLNDIIFPSLRWQHGRIADLPRHDGSLQKLPSAQGLAGRLFAFGIDASLLPSMFESMMNQTSSLSGATGNLSINDFGAVERQPVFLQFEGGRARLLNRAD